MLGGSPLPFRSVAPDQDRNRVRAGADRLLRKVARGMPRALELGVAAAEERDDDLERLLEASEAVILGQPEGVRLTWPRVTGAEPEQNRPPLISSRVSAVFAMIPAFR